MCFKLQYRIYTIIKMITVPFVTNAYHCIHKEFFPWLKMVPAIVQLNVIVLGYLLQKEFEDRKSCSRENNIDRRDLKSLENEGGEKRRMNEKKGKIDISDMLLFSCQVMSNTLQFHGLKHARLACLSLFPGVCSNSCPLSWWCCPTISSSVVPFPSCF